MAWQQFSRTPRTQEPAQGTMATSEPMVAPTKQEAPKVWALQDVDLEPVIAWLHPVLQKKWPRCMESSLRFWLKTAMNDRHTYVVCSKNVCAMVHVVMDVKEPEPRVIENFIRGNKHADEAERHMVYDHLVSWAQSIGAREFVFNIDSDMPRVQPINRAAELKRKVESHPTYSVMLKDD